VLTRSLTLAAVFVVTDALAAGEVQFVTADIVRKAPECASLFAGTGSGSKKANLWESAKQPALESHCGALQKGAQRVDAGNFVAALDFAQKADDLTPGLAGPNVVRGLAYARWGKPKDAVAAFEKAKSLHPRALDDATVLDDYGASLVRVGKLEAARRAYRALLPRVAGPTGMCGVQATCAAASLAYLTAGVLAMDEGTSGLEEAVAILREARNKSDGELRRVAAFALALALDRRGDADQAREIASDMAKTRGVPAEVPPEITVRFPGLEEAHAVRAIGLETVDAANAIIAWKAYLDGGGDKRAWAANAKAHIAKLEKGPKTEPKKDKPK
jgi:Flp pilus assembly protein TadD